MPLDQADPEVAFWTKYGDLRRRICGEEQTEGAMLLAFVKRKKLRDELIEWMEIVEAVQRHKRK